MPDESQGIDPYAVVLADLRAQRDRIDAAIAAIESLHRGGSSLTATSAGSAGPEISDRSNPYLGMTIPEAAKKLLATRRETMRNSDIAAALKAGGLILQSKDPANTVGSVLQRRATDVGDIVRTGRGTWGLKEWVRGSLRPKDKNGEKGTEEEASAPPEQSQQVSLMITAAQKARLRELDFSDEQIRDMTPEQAHRALGLLD